MKKTSKVTQAYSDLGKLGRGEMTPPVIAELRHALEGRESLLVSKAADIAAERGLRDLIPVMAAACLRLLESDSGADKGCRAKTSLVKALNQLEANESQVFVAGARCVQMEGSFGPPEDTGAGVRCESASGLARINDREAHYILVELMVDPEKPVRIAAARAITYLGALEGELALRLKALCGDREPEVVGECFLGLMTMSPNRSLEFVARFLSNSDAELMEGAALALGSSHLPEAFALLKEAWEDRPFPSVRRGLLLPIALIRSDEAFAFLLQALEEADKRTAAAALPALHLYAGEAYVDRVRSSVQKRADPDIEKRFREEFEG